MENKQINIILIIVINLYKRYTILYYYLQQK